jgi:hypothetical protein
VSVPDGWVDIEGALGGEQPQDEMVISTARANWGHDPFPDIDSVEVFEGKW